MSTTDQPFEEYAKIELFGHTVLIARISKAEIGDFVRCDVLAPDGGTLYTKLVNPKAVYAINLITRDVAIALAKARGAEPPVHRFELPAPAEPAGNTPSFDGGEDA